MKAQKPTLIQIAKQTECSLSTVSRVLSGSSYPVSAANREKIFQAAETLGYVSPSIRKKAAARGQEKTIGVLIPTITNPFYSLLMSGIETLCERHHFTPIFCSSRRLAQRERDNIRLLCHQGVKGLILSSINEELGFLSALARQKMPIVVFDQSVENLNLSYVKFDYFGAGKLAVEYLYLKGHRRIAFASPPITRTVRQDALDGYLSALEELLVPRCPEYVILSSHENEQDNSSYDFENGKYLAQRILQLEERPTAVFTLNDITAFGLMDEFRRQGVSVPDDISVIGFDNLETSAISFPPLTTINQPAYEIGRLSAKILLDKISGESTENAAINLRASIVERASVKTMY